MNKLLFSELHNFKKLYYVVNRIFSIQDLMGEEKLKGIYCPFHGESKSEGSKPSSRFYTNEVPVKLWCFQEHRSYYSYHYIKRILHKDPLEFLIKNASEKEIKYYLNEYNENNDEEDENITYQIDSSKDLLVLFASLDSSKDYSKWYLV